MQRTNASCKSKETAVSVMKSILKSDCTQYKCNVGNVCTCINQSNYQLIASAINGFYNIRLFH